jgi:twitching motility protein PilT
MIDLLKRILTPQQIKRFSEEMELDFAMQIQEGVRFRVNLYRQKGSPALAFRLINVNIPTFDDLHLPKVLERLLKASRYHFCYRYYR